MEDYISPYEETAERIGIANANSDTTLKTTQARQLQYEMETVEKNLAETQLDCEETLNKIYHLLKQDVLKVNEQGILDCHESLHN